MKGMVRQRGKMWTAYWWTPNPVTGDWTQRSKGGLRPKRPRRSTSPQLWRRSTLVSGHPKAS